MKTVSNSSSDSESTRNYAVMLPCSSEEFGDFISSLLGKPQTIEKVIRGNFEIDEKNISNIYHLVNQRIAQQNDAQLIQFTVTLAYDDDSTHLLNSFEDFQNFAEVKPLVTVAVHLSWSYLVRFHRKQAVEKQVIEMSITAGSSDLMQTEYSDAILIMKRRNWLPDSSVFFRINHTERTWGVDIESLLTGHIRGWMKKPDPLRSYITAKADGIGAIFGILFFLGALLGVFLAGNRLVEHHIGKMVKFSGEVSSRITESEKILRKIDFLTDIVITGVWPRFVFNSVSFLCVALLAAIIFAFIVSEKAQNKPPSFVMLSEETKKYRERVLARGKEQWRQFLYSIAIGVATGVVGNLVYSYFFGGT